ncbi:hypothetical protein [Vreelandella arcis]|uniref:Uncharacterized protein n=1 Tax=Vreelandella arcis TaxID=416873 RepID=A0A1G9ZAN3_9GAMM|nr:hypothetical protein [Halomonas arcis]SDN17533.1 hypothetical protein SAMN04487951_10311 [Halomonas arcis]
MSSPLFSADAGQYKVGNQATDAIQGLLESLELPYLSERSVKCLPGRWSSQRCLFMVPLETAPSDVLSPALERLLADLGMAGEYIAESLAPLNRHDVADPPPSRPTYLHLGVEGDRCKIYWEDKRPDTPSREKRFVLYRAWKWRANEPVARSDYVLLTTASDARRAIEQELAAATTNPLHDVLEQLQVSFALQQEPWPPLTVRIEETQNGRPTGRDSLNLHVNRALLPLGTIAGTMFSLARDWQSAPRETLIDWIAGHGNEVLSNISFGRNEAGQPFVTCYHGAKRHHPHKIDTLNQSDRIPGSPRRAREQSTPTA